MCVCIYLTILKKKTFILGDYVLLVEKKEGGLFGVFLKNLI